MKHKILGATLSLLALVINPSFGCSSPPGDGYTFSESDMRAAVAGKYKGSFNGTSEVVTLTLDEGESGASTTTTQSQSLRQLQCRRTFSFVKPAAACIPMTTMTVSGQVASSYASITTSAVSGTFTVTSLDLDTGTLILSLPDGSSLSADFSNGVFGAWQYAANTGDDYKVDLVKQ